MSYRDDRRVRSPDRRGRSPDRRGRSPDRRGRSPDRRGRSPDRRNWESREYGRRDDDGRRDSSRDRNDGRRDNGARRSRSRSPPRGGRDENKVTDRETFRSSTLGIAPSNNRPGVSTAVQLAQQKAAKEKAKKERMELVKKITGGKNATGVKRPICSCLIANFWLQLVSNRTMTNRKQRRHAVRTERGKAMALREKKKTKKRTWAITLGRFDVVGVGAFYALCLACWAMAGQQLGLGGSYQLGLAVAALQATYHLTLIRRRQREQCFKAFRLNHWLGLSVWLGAAVDTAWPTLLG